MPTLSDQIRAALTEADVLGDLAVTVRISGRRKRLGITVEPGGREVTLHAPATARPQDAVDFVRAVRHRIGRAALKARENAPDHPVKELVNGESIYWLGMPARLRLLDGDAPMIERVSTGHGWWMHLHRDAVQHGARPFIRWYSEQGTELLGREAPQWWARMAYRQPLPEVRVADIGRTRWGKYEPARHRVTLAWQTLQLPLAHVRYVLVHELAHATRPAGRAHGPEFWRVVERTMPGARDVKRQMDQQGRTAWMGDIHAPRTGAGS
ncbi:M48 family metallopeptidase [Streptomyces sp. NPDC054771]